LLLWKQNAVEVGKSAVLRFWQIQEDEKAMQALVLRAKLVAALEVWHAVGHCRSVKKLIEAIGLPPKKTSCMGYMSRVGELVDHVPAMLLIGASDLTWTDIVENYQLFYRLAAGRQVQLDGTELTPAALWREGISEDNMKFVRDKCDKMRKVRHGRG